MIYHLIKSHMANPEENVSEENVSVETVLNKVLASKGPRQYKSYYRALDPAIDRLRQEVGQTALNNPVLDPKKANDIEDTLQFTIVRTETKQYTIGGDLVDHDIQLVNQEALNEVIATIKAATSNVQE